MMLKLAPKFVSIFLLFIFLSSSILPSTLNVYAQSVDDYQKELEQKQKEKEEKESYLASVKKEIEKIQNSGYSLDYQIQLIEEELDKVKKEMDRVQTEMADKEKYISEKEKEIADKQVKVNEISDKLYRNSRINPLDILLRKDGPENVIQSLIFNKFVIASQVSYMKRLAVEMAGLKVEKEKLAEDKKNFEADQADFNESKAILADQKALLQKQLNAQVSTKGALTKQIGVLNDQISKLQEAILIAKSGQTVVPVDSVPSSGDKYATLAGFRANAPAGSFAVFSIGAYANRNGMSQYGANRRAEAGQTAEQILKAYYPSYQLKKDYNVANINITVVGTNTYKQTFTGQTYDLNTYVKHIYEMPTNWNIEALKAQAITARSFALAHTQNGQKSICPSQNCQEAKLELNSVSWQSAVDQTANWVLVDKNGNPVSTQYDAVTGGWTNTVGWDTTDGQGGSGDWMSKAWESMSYPDGASGSPWFYKAWYRLTYDDSSASCGRYPWLSNEEFSDILNTWLIVEKGEGLNVDASKILPITINTCPFPGSSGGNPYTMSQLRKLLSNPVTSVTGSPVVLQGSKGQSTTINVPTNRGVLSIPACQFKYVFNMRAPGYLTIPQKGSECASGYTFINIESK